MKKTLFWYLFREIASPLLLGLLVFTAVLVMSKLLKLTELVFSSGVPFTDILRLLLYLLPTFSIVTIPMAFLLAVLLAFGRLSGDSEIVAMKACGVSLSGLFPPVLFFAMLAYCATAFLTFSALPWGHRSYKALVREIVEEKSRLIVKEGVFNSDLPGVVLYVNRYDETEALMKGVVVQDERDPEKAVTIFADSGKLIRDPEKRTVQLHLADGSIHREAEPGGYRLATFTSYDISLRLDSPAEKKSVEEASMTLAELTDSAEKSPRGKQRNKFLLEYHRRFSIPFACFIFAIVGVPMGMQNRRSGKSSGFAASIILILAYYVLLSLLGGLAEKGAIPPAPAVWIPNAVFLLFGIFLFRRAASENPVNLSSFPARLRTLARKRK